MITNYPFGISSFGIPLVGSAPHLSIPTASGKILFVDGVNGSDGNLGTDLSAPLATISQALTNAVGDAGVTIYVFPGTYTAALTISKNDISIIAAVHSANSKRVAVAPASGIALTVGDVKRFQ